MTASEPPPNQPAQPLAGVSAMLITAGYGTRLSPLTDLLPKPAVPVANRPLAWFALDHLYRAGVRELVLNTHHLAPELEREIAPWAPADLRLRFVYEPQILGTGGGIRNAAKPPAPGETLLAMSGKYVFAPDVSAALGAHRERGAFATLVLTYAPGVRGFGGVEIDAEGWVRRFRGTPPRAAGEPELRPMFYTGLALYSDRAFADLPANGDLISFGFQRWIDRGEPVLGVVDPGVCRDAGMSLWHYWEANMALLTGQVAWPVIAPNADQALCAPDVERAAGATIERSAIGRGARIGPGVRIKDAIVWPGAEVTADVERQVVLPDGRRCDVGLKPQS